MIREVTTAIRHGLAVALSLSAIASSKRVIQQESCLALGIISSDIHKDFYVASLLHLRFIFACLPDFYLFRLADFKATASRRLADIFKLAALQTVSAKIEYPRCYMNRTRGNPKQNSPVFASSTFRILAHGRWSPQQVHARYDPTPYLLPPPHDALAHSHWQKLLGAHEHLLFNGQLFRLENYAGSPSKLELVLGHTCYRDQVYCNAHTQELAHTLGVNKLACGLGVSAIVMTRDGYLPLMRRSSHVGEGPNQLDVFGGHAHPDQHWVDGQVDLFRAITEEIVAELNVAPEDIAENFCLGLVENLRTHKPDLVFEICLRNSRAEIEQCAANAAEAEEVAELFFVRNEASSLHVFLVASAHELTPSACGTLALHEHNVGEPQSQSFL